MDIIISNNRFGPIYEQIEEQIKENMGKEFLEMYCPCCHNCVYYSGT